MSDSRDVQFSVKLGLEVTSQSLVLRHLRDFATTGGVAKTTVVRFASEHNNVMIIFL